MASIDMSGINEGLKRWRRKVKHKANKPPEQDYVEIYESLLATDQPSSQPEPSTSMRTLDHAQPLSTKAFKSLVDTVKVAISEHDIHPRLNSKGSSGSYFVKDYAGENVGIFKPKDEEPYGRFNPKLLKRLQRNLIGPILGFGRSCLIPNTGYLSETAASVMDRRLQLYIVPRTEIIKLSSKSFFYDWIDRRAAQSKSSPKPLPEKAGSLQLFADGFTDATEFFRSHPWPTSRGQGQIRKAPKHRRRGFKLFQWLQACIGRSEAVDSDEEDSPTDSAAGSDTDGDHLSSEGYLRHPDGSDFDIDIDDCTPTPMDFVWTIEVMHDFRGQLERLIVLDYIIRNTDRGLDNFMIKHCWGSEEDPYTRADPRNRPRMSLSSYKQAALADQSQDKHSPSRRTNSSKTRLDLLRREQAEAAYSRREHIHLAAIDNGLAFPISHPKGWRSYAFGWLYLPLSVIGLPWSQLTRKHFLSLLTDVHWWEETVKDLRAVFKQDPDFSPQMFRRQMAVVKGQAKNLIESLQDPNEGPLELCQRPLLLVWDDFVEKPVTNGPVRPAPHEDEQAPLLPRKSALKRTVSERPNFARQISSLKNADAVSDLRGIDVLESVQEEKSARLRRQHSRTLSNSSSAPSRHVRWNSIDDSATEPTKIVVSERIEVVESRAFFAC